MSLPPLSSSARGLVLGTRRWASEVFGLTWKPLFIEISNLESPHHYLVAYDPDIAFINYSFISEEFQWLLSVFQNTQGGQTKSFAFPCRFC